MCTYDVHCTRVHCTRVHCTCVQCTYVCDDIRIFMCMCVNGWLCGCGCGWGSVGVHGWVGGCGCGSVVSNVVRLNRLLD